MLLLDRLLCFENNHMYTERMVQEFWLPHGELHEKMYFGLCLGNFPTVGDLIFARYCLGIQKERWQKDSSTKSLCERQPGLHAAHCRQRCRFNLLDIFGVKGCILESLKMEVVLHFAASELRGVLHFSWKQGEKGALSQSFSYGFVFGVENKLFSLRAALLCTYICRYIPLCASPLSGLNKSDLISGFQQFWRILTNNNEQYVYIYH